MAPVTCARCFAVFEADDARPGFAPLCTDCAPRAPAAALPAGPASVRRRSRRPVARRLAVVFGVLAAALAVAAGMRLAPGLLRGPPPAPPPPSVVESRVDDWRAAGLVPAARPDQTRAAARAAQGWSALAADLPERTAAALQAFREAIALAPDASDAAVAGYVLAFAEAAGDEPDAVELRSTHDMVREALARSPARTDLLVAYARLLLAVPSAANFAEAHAVAERALAGAPRDPTARLALGLAQLPADPAKAARTLEDGLAAAPAERRLLTAAARARWAAGDAVAALAHADARLALDRGHPDALALRAEIEAASDRIADARATLGRWEAASADSPLPPLLLARIAYQRDDDPVLARKLLDVALSRKPGAFTAARILAHRSAVELAAGNAAAAEAAVEDALRRVPASAPARFQAALLAFGRGNAAALRESAGVLGDRAGPLAARMLAARTAELSGTEEESQQAYLALAALAPRNPTVLLATAGALARLRAPGPALEVARRALERDPGEGRLRRVPTDFWEGPAPLAEAARRLEAIGRAEPLAASTAFAAAAECELLLGRTVAAERLARAASAASPQSAAPIAILAQVALDRSQAPEASTRAASALEVRPGDPILLAIRGRALETLGRTLDAESALRRASEAMPDLATARLGLARLLARRGETGEARTLVEALVRDEPDLAEARGALLALAVGRPARASRR